MQIDDYNMVSFIPLNINDEDSITAVLSHIDNAIQYGEDQEPKEPKVNILYTHFLCTMLTRHVCKYVLILFYRTNWNMKISKDYG